MPHNVFALDWHLQTHHLTTASEISPDALGPITSEMLSHVKTAAMIYDIDFINYIKLPDPSPPPPNVKLFTLDMIRGDGRVFGQGIRLEDWTDTNPSITFNVPVGWKLSEYNIIPSLRLSFQKMTNAYHMYELHMSPH